jgi:hypothetical protein
MDIHWKRLECLARSAPWTRSIEFMVVSKSEGHVFFAEPLVMREVTIEEQCTQSRPTFSLDFTEAQRLMDELWNCGLRPSEGTGSAGAMAATERHLKDLQRLVFKDKS